MVQQIKWNDRKFESNLPIGVFPCLLERYRGTPARLEEMTHPLSSEISTTRLNETWSIQDQVKHLLAAEAIWEIRLGDYLTNKEILTIPNFTEKDNGDLNPLAMQKLLTDFRAKRMTLVHKFDQFNEEEAGKTALHPRLKVRMKVVDFVFFICEHDDHHIARMRNLIQTISR